MTELTDQQLLIKMHGGHHAAAEVLWKRLSPRLHMHARTLAREGSLGEDCVQAAFLKVLSLSKREVQLIKDPLPWLMMVVRREVFQALRARGRAARRERCYGVEGRRDRVYAAKQVEDDCSLVVGPELREQLEVALDSLPRREREVIMLRHFVMLTFDQMELALGIARSTVVSRYRAGIARLETLMHMQPSSQGGSHGATQDLQFSSSITPLENQGTPSSVSTTGHRSYHPARSTDPVVRPPVEAPVDEGIRAHT